ncbi:MAG TPA: hypothetical protein VNK89_04085 [Thermoflexus sp.]|nr:hypothetical protein [Thermoflexus sp.]
MGRIYQVDYEQAFALCGDLERILGEIEQQIGALQGMMAPVESNWLPHGATVRAHGDVLAHQARKYANENRAAVAALRQALLSLKALEEEQARRMRSARAR